MDLPRHIRNVSEIILQIAAVPWYVYYVNTLYPLIFLGPRS